VACPTRIQGKWRAASTARSLRRGTLCHINELHRGSGMWCVRLKKLLRFHPNSALSSRWFNKGRLNAL
jgi:hypothetical protein